ncbi:hypothetical protein Tco_1203910 [Tanacetum coccineum]
MMSPCYESAFVSCEVQSSSINENDEQMYPTHTKIINSTIDDDQINSNIQFDSVKGNVNSGSVEKDTHVYDQCALETLARNAYDEAAKQQRFAQKVQQQNMTLTSQIEMYKERNRVLENITKDNNYLKEFLEADERAKRVQKQAESQLYRDRYIIRDLEKQRDKQANFKFQKVIVASRTGNIENPLNVIDSKETLEDAFKSQQKMNDPIAVANKQNCWTIDYKQLNALYNDFVPQKESFVVQTCSSSSYIPFVKILETKSMPNTISELKARMKNGENAKKETVYVRKNKQTDNTFAKVVSNNENVIDVAVANASKAKTLLTERLISKAILQERGRMQAHISSQIQNAIDNAIPYLVDASVRSYMSGYILHVHPAQVQSSFIPEQQYQLYLAMKADPLLQQQDIAIWLALQMKFEKTQTDSYASDDDEIPTKQVTQDIMEEISLTIDEAKLKKMADEMVRQRCTSGDEHQYHIDQMKNFLQSNIVWESRKEILVSLHPQKITPLVQSCQRDPEDPTLSLINQDLFVHLEFIVWERVHNFQLGIESYQQKINLTAPTITFPGIEEYDVFSIVYEPVHGNIYTNSKKEKRVTRHSKIHKLCDATLRRTLEGLKSYNNDVKYGYVQKELTNDEVEFLKFFEEEIEVRLNYRDQMRRWEIVTTALEAQATTMANADNTNRNTEEREAPVARKFSYKEFMSCQPIIFKEALFWWNSFTQSIGIEEAYKITWVEFKKILIKKYCPRTEVQKIEDEFLKADMKGMI